MGHGGRGVGHAEGGEAMGANAQAAAMRAMPAANAAYDGPAVVPRLLDLLAWRDAAIAWIAQRLLIAPFIYLGHFVLTGHRGSALDELRSVWFYWDAAHYAGIAQQGYSGLPEAAFYPLFPLLERAISLVTGGDVVLAGVIVANTSCLAAFALLRVLVEREAGLPIARRTLILVAAFPTSFYFAMAYSESLFLLLSVGVFLALSERRWLLAGGVAALAALTRPVGVLLVLPLLIEVVREVRMLPASAGRWAALARGVGALALPVAGFAAFNIYVALHFGAHASTYDAEGGGWGRQFSWPWDGFARATVAALSDSAFIERLHAGLDIGFTALLCALSLLAIRKLPARYAVYVCATSALVLLTPIHKYDWAALASNSRFMLVMFPLFWLLARWSGRPLVALALAGVSAALLLLFALTFAAGTFVA